LKSNITFIALNNGLKKEIAKNLAEKLEMFYIDINELIKYQIPNTSEVITLAGIEYYNEEETKIVKTVSSYENTLITIDLDTFFNNNNYLHLKENSVFIYLKVDFENFKKLLEREIPKKSRLEKSLSKKVFNERNKIIELESDIIINFNDETSLLSDIFKKIKDFYKEVL